LPLEDRAPEKKYLFLLHDIEAPLIVSESDIGTEVSLSDFGIDADEDKVFLSKYDAILLPLEP